MAREDTPHLQQRRMVLSLWGGVGRLDQVDPSFLPQKPAMELNLYFVGIAICSGCSSCHIKSTVSVTILATVETLMRKEKASVLKDDPVIRNLKKCYHFVPRISDRTVGALTRMETFEMSSASVSDEQEEILSTASVEIDVDFSQESNVGQLDIDDTSRRPSQTAVETTRSNL
ncbi:hypothetical protein RRG08_010245 [Elysia crispata]|uniref:Uncharacterized protein n=1 Tax=Elysia crispata TaxID=231223 RepID=A0AAE1CY62_9GAST|nr:hypothetical protein RRG08_010245 [Elysia crispata]